MWFNIWDHTVDSRTTRFGLLYRNMLFPNRKKKLKKLLYKWFPHGNEIYMQHIQLFGMKIYFEGLGIIYVKYILANISQKIYVKYILIIQLFAKIYFIYFDIYVTYLFFHVGLANRWQAFLPHPFRFSYHFVSVYYHLKEHYVNSFRFF